METTILQFVAVFFLVLLNGFFVAAEFALVKIRETQLIALADGGHRGAAAALEIVRKLDAALSSTQLGITIASLGLGWLGKPAFAGVLAPALRWFKVGPVEADWIAFAVGFTAITFLHIVAGELAPKSLAIQNPLATSLWVARPLRWFYQMFYPAIWLLNHAAFWLLRFVGLAPVTESHCSHSEDEIRLILVQNRVQNSRPLLGHNVALNSFDLSKRFAREIMRPRQEIIALDTEATIEECLELAEQTRYSRFPLCKDGNLDQTLGLVHSKDLMSHRLKASHGRDLRGIARPLLFVPETAHLDKLLAHLLERKGHMALVVDEYGGTIGMVTLEDVLEMLVGPIEDEFDQEQQLVRQIGSGTWELKGALPMHKLADLVGEPIEDANLVSTLSGWFVHRLGRFPLIGDELSLQHGILRVEAIVGTKVARIRLEKSVERASAAA